MKIKSLKIDIPLFTGVREYIFTETKEVIKIEGSNGSGKSIIMSLLTPDPITKDYLFNIEKHGFKVSKEIVIEEDKNVFTLYSEVGKTKTRCSFKVNDEEKCLNGSLTMYRQLIQDYNLQTIKTVNQKTSTFFDLSPAKRKDYVQTRFIENYELIEDAKLKIKNEIIISKSQEVSFREKLIDNVNEYKQELSSKTMLMDKAFEVLTFHNTQKDLLSKLEISYIEINPYIGNNLYIPKNYDGSFDIDLSEEINLGVLAVDFYERNKQLSIKYKSYLNKVTELAKSESLFTSKFNTLLDEQMFPNMQSINQYKLLQQKLGELSTMFIPVETLEDEQNVLLKIEQDNITTRQKIANKNTSISLKQNMLNGKSDNVCLKLDSECLDKINHEIIVELAEVSVIENDIITDAIISTVKEKIVYQERLITLNQEINTLKSYFSNIDTTVVIDLNNITDEYFTLKNTNELLRNEVKTLSTMVQEVDDLDYDLTIMKKKAILIDMKDAKEITTKLRNTFLSNSGTKEQLVTLRESISILPVISNEDIKVMKSEIYDLTVLIDRHEESTKALPELHDKVTSLETGQKILQNNNLPSILSLRKLKLVEEKINDLIHTNFTQNLTVEFRYSKTKLDIFVKTKLTENVYEKLSGYETAIIKLAFEIVMTDYNTDILRLDENDSQFDTENRMKFASFIARLIDSDVCEQIFLISHNQEFNNGILDELQIINTQ